MAPVQTLIEHWDGSTWTLVTSPDTSPSETNELAAVSCTSSTDCWAVGIGYLASNGAGQGLIEQWNGTAWSIVPTADVSDDFEYGLEGVTCVSSTECSAVGSTGPTANGTQSVAEQWSGTAWSIVSTPNVPSASVTALFATACATPADCWAVGWSSTNSGEPQNVAERSIPTVSVVLPSNDATLSGSTGLDAAAYDSAPVTKVVYELTGGTLSNQVIATPTPTPTPTYYGWLAEWNTTTVANGTYSVVAVATDADNNTDTSTPITVTVDNPPTTSVLIPSNGATPSGSTTLDASASNATSVEFRLFGGSYGYNAPVLCTATLTYYGWVCSWSTTTVPNGSYELLSEAFSAGGSAFSSGVSITVNN
jgi:hypothetical protein